MLLQKMTDHQDCCDVNNPRKHADVTIDPLPLDLNNTDDFFWCNTFHSKEENDDDVIFLYEVICIDK